MKVARSVAEVLSQHTTLALECIDRLYLNVDVPVLQRAAGAAYFFRKMRGAAVPSSVLMAPVPRPRGVWWLKVDRRRGERERESERRRRQGPEGPMISIDARVWYDAGHCPSWLALGHS